MPPRFVGRCCMPDQSATGGRRLWSAFLHPGRGAGRCGLDLVRRRDGWGHADPHQRWRRHVHHGPAEDLISLLDGLGAESRRLEGEIAELERTKAGLQSGADSQRLARENAEKGAKNCPSSPARRRPKVPASGCGSRIPTTGSATASCSTPSASCAMPEPKSSN